MYDEARQLKQYATFLSVLDASIFRAYDIRGIVGGSLTDEAVYSIGRAFGTTSLRANEQRVVVGGDCRESTGPLRNVLHKGLLDTGIKVVDIGIVPTPVLYFAARYWNIPFAVMVTGSHCAAEYNGLKFTYKGIRKTQMFIQDLRGRTDIEDFDSGNGDLEYANVSDSYENQFYKSVCLRKKLKVVIDCGNGATGEIAPRLFKNLGCDVRALFSEFDGRFPNHHPDPLIPENLEDLIEAVRSQKADIGIAFDGDGDRIGTVTPDGTVVWPDQLLTFFCEDILRRHPGKSVVFDVKCSRNLWTTIERLGGVPVMWKTGHSNIKERARELRAPLAGEFSGHICFSDRWYGFDDALYCAARIIELLSESDRNYSELASGLPKTFSTPEISIPTTDSAKFQIVRTLIEQGQFDGADRNTIDGLRLDYSDGWGLVRASNTGPTLSLRFEAHHISALKRIQQSVYQALANIDPTLQMPKILT